MGTSLSRPCPSPHPRALRGPHLAPCGRRQLLAPRARPAVHAPGSIRRRSSTSWQPCSLLAAFSGILETLRLLFLGLLTTFCRWGCRLKAMLSAPGSQVSCRRNCESIVDTVTPCVLQKRFVTGLQPSAPRNVHDVSTAERVGRGPSRSGKGLAQAQGPHRKDPQGTGTPQRAFSPLGVHGGLSSFVPRPGPLLGAVPQEESSEDPYSKKSPSSHRSSCPTRNAITSSYSSTMGCYPVQRRRGLATSQAAWPPRSPKKVSQKSPLCPAGVPALRQKNQPEKDADTTTRQKTTQRNCSSPADCSRSGKRKVCLLPHRRGEPLRLPSPPQPGFRVTAEDLDREKTAALHRIQDALRGDTEATCSCSPTSPPSALALPAAVAAPLPASDSQVTSGSSSGSSQPLLLGSHPGCSGSNVASTQALLMQPRGQHGLSHSPPQGCLRCLEEVATRDPLPRPHSGLLVGSGPEPAPFTALPSMDSRQLRLQSHSRP
ncbi:putative POM121-like protein 1 [Mustela putorius furo]|uniref:POM121-like protein 1 n=1 Tax=Mustela putorius furo TaxID=9669 RepID=A0A8U0SEF8_MUSPF|nr:putative POM121-like protein 1 [Mustela putorius furo]